MLKTGAGGIVSALTVGTLGQFLAYNGTWATPPNTTYGLGTASADGLLAKR